LPPGQKRSLNDVRKDPGASSEALKRQSTKRLFVAAVMTVKVYPEDLDGHRPPLQKKAEASFEELDPRD